MTAYNTPRLDLDRKIRRAPEDGIRRRMWWWRVKSLWRRVDWWAVFGISVVLLAGGSFVGCVGYIFYRTFR